MAGGLKQRQGSKQIGFVTVYSVQPFRNILNYETEGRVNTVSISNEGRWVLAVAGQRDSSIESEALCFFERKEDSYEKIFSINRKGGYRTAVMSKDGKRFVVGSFDGVVEVFSNENGQIVKDLSWVLEKTVPSTSVRFVNMTDDGQWFGVSGNNGKFYLFNSARAKAKQAPEWSYKSSAGLEVYGISVSNDGRLVAAACSEGDSLGNGARAVQVVENICKENVCSPHWWQRQLQYLFF